MAKRDKVQKRARRDRGARQVFVAYCQRVHPEPEYRGVYEAIEKAYDVTFLFADEDVTDERGMKKLGSLIAASDIAVFDLTGWDASVALQLGYAMARGDQWYVLVDRSKGERAAVPPHFEGLGRLEYASYAELGEKLGAVAAHRYSRKAGDTIEDFLAERRKQVVGLLRGQSLALTSIAQLLGVDVAVAALVVRPLVDQGVLRAEGDESPAKYTVPRSAKRGSDGEHGAERASTAPNTAHATLRGGAPAPASASGDEAELNEKELRVLGLLRRRGTGVHLDEIGAACFRSQKPHKANSWARNSLRRLVARTLVRKVGRGLYEAIP